MKNQLLAFLLPHIVKSLIAAFDLQTVKLWIDKSIDTIEDAIDKSESKVDDSFLPMIYAVRSLLDIPDDDDSAASPKMA
ncbi:hypothetical protein [Nocardia mangyaensis]|uniref:hypothetical protein n=1 Tax=Nocardia mangyaensis TaxID=2213200 RepID=UPI002676177C|nr:hypothetical protein [Nocardia mangyaensis]MDO3651396.1 hypothetical protein [Nocardia mangyaensis]